MKPKGREIIPSFFQIEEELERLEAYIDEVETAE